MYLLPIHVPVYLDGDRPFVTTEWKRSLELLRDSFHGRFGPIVVACPFRDVRRGATEQQLESMEHVEDITVRGLIPADGRARDFWLRDRARWISALQPLIAQADVVHGCLDDVYRPIAFTAWRLAADAGRVTVFVQDTDIADQILKLNRQAGVASRMKSKVYAAIYERWCRLGVARSHLSLLKGRSLIERYGRFARNVRPFHDTSHSLHDVIGVDQLETRLRTLPGRAIRLVYCGRFIARKGLLRGLDLLARARRGGARLELDLIGDGEQRGAIEAAIRQPDLVGAVRLIGSMKYGPDLLRRLSTYDALYFTPPAEDTPRMIFDGFAVGLPLVGTAIDYIRERAVEDQAAHLLSLDDDAEAAAQLTAFASDHDRVAALSRLGREAGIRHAAESWYTRRAAWTIEAFEKAST